MIGILCIAYINQPITTNLSSLISKWKQNKKLQLNVTKCCLIKKNYNNVQIVLAVNKVFTVPE